MTATDGVPALHHSDAIAARGGPAISAQRRALHLRTVLGLAKAEASLLTRSLLVLAGLLAGGAVIWILIYRAEPLWWNADWQIGDGQLILAVGVIMATQLAAGRARRDGMADLYASYPVTAGIRTLGQLAGLAGVVPASLALVGAAAATVELLGPIGSPSIAVFAGGLLLVIAAGAAGIAIGARFPHPMAGVLSGLALFLISSQISGAVTWLLPWEFLQDELGTLPGPLPGYPPIGAHVLELTAIAALAAITALAVSVRGFRARSGLATAGILALALVCLAGSLQLRPISAASLNRLAREATDPATVQRCTTISQVRYCLYPDFGSLLPALEGPVKGVLGHVPVQPTEKLTIRQIVSVGLPAPDLTHGHSARQVSRWYAQFQPTTPISATIYLPVGAWPAFGQQLANAHFNVALAAADWAVRLPLHVGSGECAPINQAREAVAIWLAIRATQPPASELREVGHTGVRLWAFPGLSDGQVSLFGGGPPQLTQAGYLLARAMTTLPDQKVARVLRDGWARWLNWHATDSQLAAALGIRMPSVPVLKHATSARPGATTSQGSASAPNPVCTS